MAYHLQHTYFIAAYHSQASNHGPCRRTVGHASLVKAMRKRNAIRRNNDELIATRLDALVNAWDGPDEPEAKVADQKLKVGGPGKGKVRSADFAGCA